MELGRLLYYSSLENSGLGLKKGGKIVYSGNRKKFQEGGRTPQPHLPPRFK